MTSHRERLPYLTGARAIAAYLVLLSHSADTAFVYGGASIAHPYVECLAYLGMSLFFVLSGFVITYTYQDLFSTNPWHRASWSFFVARFARLYPLYFFFVMGEVHNRSALLSGSFLEQVSFLTLTQSWWNMQMLTFPPGWSISTECFFYSCFALWMLSGRTTSRGSPSVHAVITCAGIFGLLTLAFLNEAWLTQLMQPVAGRSSSPNVWGWFQYFSPYVRIGEFIAGACAAKVFMAKRYEPVTSEQRRLAHALSLLCCLVVGLLTIGNAAGWWSGAPFVAFLAKNFGYAPFLAYLLYACGRHPGRLAAWCSTRWMQSAGEISYSVYILQFWVFRLYQSLASPSIADEPTVALLVASASRVIVYVLATTAIAWVSYRVIEVPCRRWLRRRLDPRPASPVPTLLPA